MRLPPAVPAASYAQDEKGTASMAAAHTRVRSFVAKPMETPPFGNILFDIEFLYDESYHSAGKRAREMLHIVLFFEGGLLFRPW